MITVVSGPAARTYFYKTQEAMLRLLTDVPADAILFGATPIRQKRTKDMSRRFQTGSVTLVGNVWKGRYWVDVPGEGKRKHPQVDLGSKKEMSKSAARSKLLEIISGLGLNKPDFVERLQGRAKAFNHVADIWIEKRLPQLSIGTQASAPGQIAKHLRPFFGALPLAKIKTGTVQDWIDGLVKVAEPKTVHNLWKMFRSIMNWHARQNDEPERTWYPLLPDIPDIPAPWFTVDEMRQIIEISPGYPGKRGISKDQYKPLFQVTAFSGLRSGEVSGLKVEDFEFARGVIHVQRSIFRGIETPTKGKRRRDVFIDSITVRMLKEYLGNRTTGRVFQSKDGKPIRNQHLLAVLDWATTLLGLKPGGMHAFRHGRVSHMRKSGVPLNIVQDQVGHQDKRTTDVYTHSEEAFVRDTMERLAVVQKHDLYTN